MLVAAIVAIPTPALIFAAAVCVAVIGIPAAPKGALAAAIAEISLCVLTIICAIANALSIINNVFAIASFYY